MTATDRWRIGLAVGLVAIGVGVLTGNAAVFLSSTVGLVYAAYGYTTRPPPSDLSVDRIVDPATPSPGDDVDVVVRVTNEADRPVADLRIADEPPAGLECVDGASRAAVSLQPDETATIEYALRANRGEHAFGDVTVVARNASGSERRRERVELTDELECTDPPGGVSLAGGTIQHPGTVETDLGGDGSEFYSIRSYRPSDPMNRVDWNRLARTGELTTVELREARAAGVVVVVDVRPQNAVVREPTELDGLELSKHAGRWLAERLLAENDQVGVALYGGSGDFLFPRTGPSQLTRVERLLEGEWSEAFGRRGWLSADKEHVDRFCRAVGDDNQLVFVTPALDEKPTESVRRFRAYGYEVTVVCPAVADVETDSGSLTRLAHDRRMRRLRECGVRVVEWAPDEPLHVAFGRGRRRWTR